MPSLGKAFFFCLVLTGRSNCSGPFKYYNMPGNGKKGRNIEALVLSLLFMLFMYLPGSAQNGKMEDKLDPVFRKILATTPVKNCPPLSGGSSKRKLPVKKASVAKKNATEKKYDCVVYTRNPNSLRAKGITVNSVLPTFVTASATLCQILQLASWPEVTYIEAPRMDEIHQ